MRGYAGKIIDVDLTKGRSTMVPLPEEAVRLYLGGFGINNKLGYDQIPAGVIPLSPANVIVFGSGALAGTDAPSTSKLMATTKYPASQAVGTAFAGSSGDTLKYSGADQLVIRGRASGPIVLRIDDGQVSLEAAADLGGLDIFETTDRLRQKYGPDFDVVAIGPAGEKLVDFSFAMVNKFATLGRGGLGAVMGSKNLKAVIWRGKQPVEIADQVRFQRAANKLDEDLRALPYRDDWLRYGPLIGLSRGGSADGLAYHNWRERQPKGIGDAYRLADYEEVYKGPLACGSCPVGCKFIVEMREGDWAGTIAPMSMPLASIHMWGTTFQMGSLDRALAANHYCDRMGIDGNTASAIIDYAVDLYDAGILTATDSGGMVLRYDYDTAISLLKLISQRQGLGDLLGDGFRGIVRQLGDGAAQRCVTIKGLEPHMDARGLFTGMAFCQMVNPRGSYMVPGNSPAFLPGRTPDHFRRYLQKLGVAEEAINRVVQDEPADVNIARLTKYAEDWYSSLSSLGICTRQPVSQCYSIEVAAELYSAATGRNVSIGDILIAGERAWNILKMANVREGFDRKDDAFPEQFYKPLEGGDSAVAMRDYYGKPLDRPAVEKLLDDYYQERGWDAATGHPTSTKLESLGI